jgi:hypothetical protein
VIESLIWFECYAFENNDVWIRKIFRKLNETALLNNGGIMVGSPLAVKILKNCRFLSQAYIS